MTTYSKTALSKAISAELAAEQTYEQAETDRRQTWWGTSWMLAAAPRDKSAEAIDIYVTKTKHSESHAKARRRTGERLPESILANTLPQPRFAMVASDWIGVKGDEDKVQEAVQALAQAEKDGMSLREFKESLTNSPWTKTPEGMTEEQENEVARKVARTRPKVVTTAVPRKAVEDQFHDNRRKAKVEEMERQAEEDGVTPEEFEAEQRSIEGLEATVDGMEQTLGQAAEEVEGSVVVKRIERLVSDAGMAVVLVRKHGIQAHEADRFYNGVVDLQYLVDLLKTYAEGGKISKSDEDFLNSLGITA